MTYRFLSLPSQVLVALFATAASVCAQAPVAPSKPAAPVRMVPMGGAGTAAVASTGPLTAGAVAPDFVSLDRNGGEVRLSTFAGKVVVLDFWATWCRPCLASLPHVQETAAAHPEDVVVLAVCTSDSRERFDAWVAENAAKYPNVVFTCDPHDRGSDSFDQRASAKHYRVAGLPTKFVVGRDGKVALTMVGFEEHDARLEAGLARAGVAVDASVAARGEQQARAEAERAAKEAVTQAPPFVPMFGSIRAGEAVPDASLRAPDGSELALGSLRGKPYVVVFGWAEVMPRKVLSELAATYGPYGVQVVAAFTDTSAEEFTAWVAKHGADLGCRLGVDPAGKFVARGDAQELEQKLEWMHGTFLAKFWNGNMRPAMPVMIAVDGDGKLLGSFRQGSIQDALGNLLPRAGVELRPEHKATVAVDPAAFRAPEPKKPEAPVAPFAIGGAAPDFTMQDAAGQDVRLSDYRGKVVVLDFWATWCGPCKAAMPHVQELARHYGGQGVVVIASCTNDERQKFEQWVAQHGGEYPDVLFAHDAAGRSPERASRRLFGVSGIPHQYVIGRDGKVVAEVIGYRQGEVLLDAALHDAGISVAPEVLEKAAADRAARDEKRGETVPALPLRRGS